MVKYRAGKDLRAEYLGLVDLVKESGLYFESHGESLICFKQGVT